MADGASGAGHREAGKDRVKVHVDLPREDEDWPPVAVESVWAEPMGGDAYRLDNIPWFIRNLSSGDVIEARPDKGIKAGSCGSCPGSSSPATSPSG